MVTCTAILDIVVAHFDTIRVVVTTAFEFMPVALPAALHWGSIVLTSTSARNQIIIQTFITKKLF